MDLYIPEGICFECTGCGNCCLSWPVPVTAADYDRIAAVSESLVPLTGARGRLFRLLVSDDAKLAAFTHTLEKRSDGRCEFLTEDNRCLLHREYGAEMKPAMCQLFPYTFTETPSGVYASVSFASTGVLLNSGRPLSEQKEFLLDRWQLFRRLFPGVSPDWTNLQLVDGKPIDWDRYLSLESELIRLVRAAHVKRADKRLIAASRYLVGQLPADVDVERAPRLEARPKVVDQLLIRRLMELYLPDDVFACESLDLDTKALLEEIVKPPPAVSLVVAGAKYGFNQLFGLTLGELDYESEDLLARFVYSRIFAKLYFGGGFANLSLIAGLHHLLLVVALVRIKAKMICIAQGRRRLDFFAIAELVRALERRLTQVRLSKQTTTVLEVLLTSPERAGRVALLAA